MLHALFLAGAAISAYAASPPGSFPHDYPGKPKGDLSPAWQSYYKVNNTKLTNVSFSLPTSYAGNIPVNRAGHPNNTLFFWAFERDGHKGGLSAKAGQREDEPWLIWLNGGPGSSSMIGLMTENGPVQVTSNYSIVGNDFAWNKLTDAIWIDQPVGTGYATADSNGYVVDEDQMGEDFVGFLSNLVKVFPSLATRPLYLTGESYAGTYIPYITKAIFSRKNPPVKLRKFAIGDGTMGNGYVFNEVPTLAVIETWPQLIGYDTDVFNYFRKQSDLCGYNVTLEYPQKGIMPTIIAPSATDPNSPYFNVSDAGARALRREAPKFSNVERYAARMYKKRGMEKRSVRYAKREQWKRDLSHRANGTIDSWYGCFLFEEMLDYAVNFTYPWSATQGQGFDVYYIPDALNPEAPSDPSVFFNNNSTRAALHAPTSKDWVGSRSYPFGSKLGGFDPSLEPQAFLTDLATNASRRGVDLIFYSGNDDSLVAHRGTQITIQNMTFGGTQGFSRKPSTPWLADDHQFAGIVHQERNVTYALFDHAGHLVPQNTPDAALVFLREFILGSNTTGLVQGGKVIGGEQTKLAGDILPGDNAIFFGSGTTQGTSTVPQATQASWASFLATATVTKHPRSTAVGGA